MMKNKKESANGSIEAAGTLGLNPCQTSRGSGCQERDEHQLKTDKKQRMNLAKGQICI